MNRDYRDVEAEFWSAWRIRWVPRFTVIAVLFVVMLIGSCAASNAIGDFRAGWDAAMRYCTAPGALLPRCERR